MNALTRLFRGGIDIPVAAPAPVNPHSVQTLEYMLEAGDRVAERLGVRINGEDAKNALVAIRSQSQLAAALEQRDIPILDFSSVRRYQESRIRRTIWETLSQGWRRISSWVMKSMLHGWSGVTSAWSSLLVTVPLGVPLLIDTFWYEVAFGSSYFATLIPQMVILGSGAFVTDDDPDWLRGTGRFYAYINFLLFGLPLAIITTLTASWFMAGDSGRKWVALTAKDFLGDNAPLSDPIIMMDRVLHAVPEAQLEFEALVNADGTRDSEAFLVVDVDGYADDKLHVWHGRI